MKTSLWKKLLAMMLCMLLPCAACAEALSADGLNEANALSNLRKTYASVLLDETDQIDDEVERQLCWDGTTDDGRRLQIIQPMEGQLMTFVLDGVFYEYDMTQGTLSCCAWLPGSQEAFAEDWETQLQLFTEALSFHAQANGIAAAQLTAVDKDGTVKESWQVNAAAYALQSYTCEAVLTDANGADTTETYTLLVSYDVASPLPDGLLEQLGGETFTLTLADEKGITSQQQLPASLPIYFTDGTDHLLFFHDAAFETPVEMLDPTVEDVTNGITLYYASAEA